MYAIRSYYVPVAREQLELLYDAVIARAILTVELLSFRIESYNFV